MTNVLDLSRNFCYNNNREVKARTTRRTREAMASELQLPQHYVELDEQEMMYVDGGWTVTSRHYDLGQAIVQFLGISAAGVGGGIAVAREIIKKGATYISTGWGFAVAAITMVWGFANFLTACINLDKYGSYTISTEWGSIFGMSFEIPFAKKVGV